ncbi:hypothetical protein BOX15_Mlig011913g2, partial [Macrostomum lignano]
SSQPQTPVPDGAQEPTTKEQNFLTDKTYLLSTTNSTGINLYEHLVTCLRKILEERPRDVVDIFEDISKECKRSRLAGDGDSLRGKLDRSTEIALAEIQKRLFNRPDGDDDEAMGEDDADPRLPNLLQLAFFFEQGGVGIDKDEIYRIWLSLKKLVDEKPIEKLRFWGKVLGTEQNYYVAEVEFREGEGEEEAEEEAEPERDDKDDEEGEEEETEDDTPKPNFKPAPPVPKEEPGTGANKYAYFVCNEPGKAWIRLPNATPAQIHVARRIKKFFTGRLDAPIVTYPPFPAPRQTTCAPRLRASRPGRTSRRRISTRSAKRKKRRRTASGMSRARRIPSTSRRLCAPWRTLRPGPTTCCTSCRRAAPGGGTPSKLTRTRSSRTKKRKKRSSPSPSLRLGRRC